MICLIGNVLKERYCIVEQIGHGGGGSLYLAKDMELGICRAVKEIPIAKKTRSQTHAASGISCNTEDYRLCGNRGVLLSDHGIYQGSVAGRDFSVQDKRVFFTRKSLLWERRLPEYWNIFTVRKPPVCYGDLKPDNLMFSETGHLYLIDLGSAMFDYGRKKTDL